MQHDYCQIQIIILLAHDPPHTDPVASNSQTEKLVAQAIVMSCEFMCNRVCLYSMYNAMYMSNDLSSLCSVCVVRMRSSHYLTASHSMG